MSAVFYGHLDAVSELLKHHANIEITDLYDDFFIKSKGTRAVTYAAFNGNPRILDVFIQYGVDVNAAELWEFAFNSYRHDGTSLMIASYDNNLDFVQALIKNGANIESADR